MAPSWADDVTAVATGVAAAAALVGVAVAALPYRRDVARRLREQASHISVWYGPSPVEASIRNTSNEAVYEVDIEFVGSNSAKVAEGIDTLPVLPPLETINVVTRNSQALYAYLKAGTAPEIHARFTDRDGLRWLRTSGGGLYRVS